MSGRSVQPNLNKTTIEVEVDYESNQYLDHKDHFQRTNDTLGRFERATRWNPSILSSSCLKPLIRGRSMNS